MFKALSAIIGLLKLCIIKLLNWNNIFFSGIIKISPSAKIELISQGKIRLNKGDSIESFTDLASVNGTILIEENVHLGSYCMVIAHQMIKIGQGTIIGPHVYIYDHDHKIENNKALRNQYNTKPVIIGKNVWIGTNTVILKGTVIGNNCIIGAGSVVYGTIPANTKYIQKRELIKY